MDYNYNVSSEKLLVLDTFTVRNWFFVISVIGKRIKDHYNQYKIVPMVYNKTKKYVFLLKYHISGSVLPAITNDFNTEVIESSALERLRRGN